MKKDQDRRILILGAGPQQLKLIARARARGAFVVVLDRDKNAPGAPLASRHVECDMLDIPRATAAAKEYNVDSIATGGSDQVMVTVAAVAAACGLPCHLSQAAARRATNKIAMTEAFLREGVPVGGRVFVGEHFDEKALEPLREPLVVKPADAQGQIGTSLVARRADVTPAVELALRHSRSKTAAVEEFLTGPEIAAGAWLDRGRLHLLAVTDRVTYNPPPALGISLQHIFPGRTPAGDYEEIASILTRVAAAFSVTDGPLHAQMIRSQDGLRVLEVGCRYGGANEVDLYRQVLGVDLLDCVLDLAFNHPEPFSFDLRRDAFQRHGLITLVVAQEGVLARHGGWEPLLRKGLITDGGWYRKDGFRQRRITDAYGRIGWYLVTGRSREEILQKAAEAYRLLRVSDETGQNLVFWPESRYLNE